MAPPPQPLPDDLIPGILLRLPPDDPAGIVRASAVCKAWRGVLADPAFSARYRALHPAAPVLGFLHRPSGLQLARFIPTTSFRPYPAAEHPMRHPHDCRHGRALFCDYDSRGSTAGFVVWDPVTGDEHVFRGTIDSWTQQAVLCAEGVGCDHRGCSGGPFIVAPVAMELDDDEQEGPSSIAQACFYSSDTGKWSMHLYTDVGGTCDLEDRPAALVGDSLYFVGKSGILLRYRYDMLRRLCRDKAASIRDSDFF
ncbi:hypothetical protein BAE44_0006708 [Dichanthelium oligosanthes]|uniref:F-box domain-containing protein n=1 Tax=Dichanthelium oligosanthes TaxID=888268 RepID=A0A1E5W4G3_9POAL|nr:hypothetical protein BAE44_0006708 [Dichanthelium oligosanthes]